jgi:ABC-type taurine transport system ATPase subunit
MIVKFQLINLGTILEGVVKHLKPEMAKKDVYTVIDQLAEEGLLSNPKELKELWKARKSIHIHLTGDVEEVNFSDENYILWHSALGKMIEDLNNNYNRKI